MTDLSGPQFGPAQGTAPKQLIVLVHGLGSDGQDMIGLAPVVAPLLPHALFAAPNAHQACDMAPYGYQWFSLQDRTPSVMLAGARVAAPVLDAYIDALQAKHGLTDAQTALVGFSQGTMTALHVGMRRRRPLACIVGFSGALLGPEVLTEAPHKPPVCLIHGAMDTVVPYFALGLSEAALQHAGFSVEAHTRPHLAHSIDDEGVRIAVEFLRRHLPAA